MATQAINKNIILDFDIADAEASRVGNSLTFSVEGHEPIILENFFAPENTELPNFVLPDGTVVDAKTLLSSFDIDISTAAGAADSNSSGLADYSSDSGSLVEGVDRLESLTGGVASSRPVTLGAQESYTGVALRSSGGGTNPGDGNDTGGGTDPGDGGNKNLMHVQGITVTEGLPDASSSNSGWDPLLQNEVSYDESVHNNISDKGDLGASFPEYTAANGSWSSSQADDSGTVGALYKVVDATSLDSLVSSGLYYKFGMMSSVPSVPGATNEYLHMRGIPVASFDLSSSYAQGFTENAFGAPTGEGDPVLAYKEHISDVLHNVCGLEYPIAHDTSQNADDTSAYNLNMISKDIHADSSGVIDFGWSWYGPDALGGAAFWVLKDANTGEIISGGKIAEYGVRINDNLYPDHYDKFASGTTNITVPAGGDYVLSIGTVGAPSDSPYSPSTPQLVLGTVVLNDALYSGELLSTGDPDDTVSSFTVVDDAGQEKVYHYFSTAGGERAYDFEDSKGNIHHIDYVNNTDTITNPSGETGAPGIVTKSTYHIVGADGKDHYFSLRGDDIRVDVGSGTLVVHKDGHYELLSNDGNSSSVDFSLNGSFTTANGQVHDVQFTEEGLTVSDTSTLAVSADSFDDSSVHTNIHAEEQTTRHDTTDSGADKHHDTNTSDATQGTESLHTITATSAGVEVIDNHLHSDATIVAATHEDTSTNHAATYAESSTNSTTEVTSVNEALSAPRDMDAQENEVAQVQRPTNDGDIQQANVAEHQLADSSSVNSDSSNSDAAGNENIESSSGVEVSSSNEVGLSISHSAEGVGYDILNGEEGDVFHIRADSSDSPVYITDFTVADGSGDSLDLHSILDIDSLSDGLDNYLNIERSGQDAQITVSSAEGQPTETIVLENVYAGADIHQADEINTLIMNSIILNNAAN